MAGLRDTLDGWLPHARRSVINFGLPPLSGRSLSSLSALGMGLAPSLAVFTAVVVIVGTLSSIGYPAHEAVVADLLPPERRAEPATSKGERNSVLRASE